MRTENIQCTVGDANRSEGRRERQGCKRTLSTGECVENRKFECGGMRKSWKAAA